MNNNDVVMLTELGRSVELEQLEPERRDVFERLQWLDKQGTPQTVEGLGYELKLPRIKSILIQLQADRAITLRPAKALKEKAHWKCIACGKLNIAESSDPRSVVCSKCSRKHLVTGRHVNGTLFVRETAQWEDKL